MACFRGERTGSRLWPGAASSLLPLQPWNAPRWPPSAVTQARAAARLPVPPSPDTRVVQSGRPRSCGVAGLRRGRHSRSPHPPPHAVVWVMLASQALECLLPRTQILRLHSVLSPQAFIYEGRLAGVTWFLFSRQGPSWPQTYCAGHIGLKLKDILLPKLLSTEITGGTEEVGRDWGEY